MQQFMPELNDRERLLLLQQNADKVETTTYQKPLTEEELDARREELTNNAIKLSELEDQKKEVVAGFKAQMDPLAKINKQILTEVKTRQTTITGELYHMADYENGVMTTYDSAGLFVQSRRLRPDEKQPNIFHIGKTGTND